MRTKSTSRLSLLFLSFALVLALPAMALADTLQINNDLVVGSNVSKDPGQSGTGKVWLQTADDTDDLNGCNATGSNPATVTFTSSDTSKIANPGSVTLTGCGTSAAKDFSYSVASSATAGTVQISGAVSGGKSGGTYTTTDTLTVTINAPAKQDTGISNVSGGGTYGGDASLTAKLSSSSNNLSGKTVAFELNGQAVGTDATDANGVAELSGVSLSGIDAGTYTGAVSANFTGDSGYNGSSGSGNLSVAKAATTTTVSCGAGPFTYDGTAKTPCSASVSGPGLNQSLTVNYQNNTNAGQATASASYAESANHLSSSDSKNFQIDKANAVIDVQGFDGAYDGTAKGARGTATGADGSNLSGLLDLGATFTNVPGGTANWSFSGDPNHNAASGSVAIVISKAATTTTVSCAAGPFTYNGSAHEPCSASATGPGGLNQTLAVSYQNNVNAGQATASASYAESANHLGSSDSENFTIDARPITITADAKSKLFGDADPALTYQHTSGTLVGNDQITGSLTRDPGETVGQYNILQGNVSAGQNYAINYVGAKLTIGAWTTKGFYAPVDMGGVYNTVKNGSTVPLKFELFKGATELTDTSAIKSLQATKVSCTTGSEDAIEELAATGGTSLRYDSTGGQYIYNWQTPKAAGSCYKVTVTAQDGSTLIAYFKLK